MRELTAVSRFMLIERPNGKWSVAYDNVTRPPKPKEEAQAELDRILATPPCGECGDVIGLVEEWRSDGKAIAEAGLCETCYFWVQQIEEGGGLVHRGVHYRDGGNRPSIEWGRKHVLGFGGRKFRVTTPDGQVIETNNLWSQGPVPDRFRDRLPDNCEVDDA